MVKAFFGPKHYVLHMNQPFLRTLQHISSFRTTTPSPPSPHLLLIPLISLYSFFSFIVPSIGFSKHETFSPPLLERGTPISLPALLLCVHPSQTKHYLTVVWVHKDKDGREREAERAIRLLKDREASTNGGIKKDRSVLQHRRSWEKKGGTRSTLYLCNIARSLSLSPLEPVQLLRLWGGSVWVLPCQDCKQWRQTGVEAYNELIQALSQTQRDEKVRLI